MAPELAYTFSRVSLGPKFVKSAKRVRLEKEIVFNASSSRANQYCSVLTGANPDPARAAASHSLPIYITLLIRVKIKIWIIKRAGVIQCNNSVGTHMPLAHEACQGVINSKWKDDHGYHCKE